MNHHPAARRACGGEISFSGETLWIATNGARPLIKIESGAARGELTALRTTEASGTTSYRDPLAGFSFTLPPGWMKVLPPKRTAGGSG